MLGLGNSLVAGGAPSEWTPLELSNLLSWQSSKLGLVDASGAFPDDGETLASWEDQSGNGRTMTVNATAQPTYLASEQAVNFSAGNMGMTFTEKAFAELTIYIKVKFTDGHAINTGDILVSDIGGSDFARPNLTPPTQMRWRINSANKNFTLDSALVADQYYVMGFERGPTGDDNLEFFLDNVSQGSTITNPTTNAFTIDNYYGGNKAYHKEIVMCDGRISDAERNLLYNWMLTR